MKNTVKSLVLIWLTSLTMPVLASDYQSSKNGIEKMYLSKNTPKKSENDKEYKYVYIQQTYVAPSYKPADLEGTNEYDKETIQKETSDTKEIEKDIPKLKRIYLGVYGGYFYTKDDMTFTDTQKCTEAYKSKFFCPDGISNPMNIEYKDDYFLSASFGINSADMLRLELSYYRLGKEIEMEGFNQVNKATQKYISGIDLKGGSVNLYLDLVGDRRQPYLLFVPYVMAGIGASQITLDDITFTDTTSTNYTIGGKEQSNRTVIYGAGFTAGLNNYVSLDIGYRLYKFGKIKTDIGMSDGTATYDTQLESELNAHIATVGIKLQI
ncbi:MAG: outer membrane beta-barrel protein [Alphaproteobacteria bacterium]|nr:outer membrane beta-barrel protein [Alphaproteobacteria bacterium]